MADKKEDPEVRVPGRLSFADNVAVAEQGEKRTKGKHKGKIPFRNSANLLIPKSNTKLFEEIKAAMNLARDNEWGDNPPKLKADKLCLQDGDEVDYAGYADHWYLSVSRTTYGTEDDNGKVKAPRRPFKIIGPRKVKDDNDEMKFPELGDDALYSGCHVNMIVRFWAQDDEEYGKRINASIEAIQFARDDAAFGGGKKVDVNNAFDEVDDDEDDSGSSRTSSKSSGGSLLD